MDFKQLQLINEFIADEKAKLFSDLEMFGKLTTLKIVLGIATVLHIIIMYVHYNNNTLGDFDWIVLSILAGLSTYRAIHTAKIISDMEVKTKVLDLLLQQRKEEFGI